MVDLTKILEPISDSLYVITGNVPEELFSQRIRFMDLRTVMHYRRSVFPEWLVMPLWFLKIAFIQVKMSVSLLRIARDVDIVIFYLSYFYQLPLLTAKILRKKTVLLQTNTISKEILAATASTPIMSWMRPLIMKTNCVLADYIVPESERLACEYSEFADKVLLYGARFVDTSLFKIKKPIDQRRNLVGYVGRLSPEKGVINLVEAIPMILKERNDVGFLINGEGPLFDEVQKKISQYPRNKVSLTNWRPREEVPDVLNELKLLVLPSYTEGLPNRILEAMACGTPVLASPVGAVTDLVSDGKTGFILENTSPKCIAENVSRALECPNLDEIVKNGESIIKQKYTYAATVKRYQEILTKVTRNKEAPIRARNLSKPIKRV